MKVTITLYLRSCSFLTSFFLHKLKTKLTKYNDAMVDISMKLRNKIVSEGEILGGRVPAGKQGL